MSRDVPWAVTARWAHTTTTGTARIRSSSGSPSTAAIHGRRTWDRTGPASACARSIRFVRVRVYAERIAAIRPGPAVCTFGRSRVWMAQNAVAGSIHRGDGHGSAVLPRESEQSVRSGRLPRRDHGDSRLVDSALAPNGLRAAAAARGATHSHRSLTGSRRATMPPAARSGRMCSGRIVRFPTGSRSLTGGAPRWDRSGWRDGRAASTRARRPRPEPPARERMSRDLSAGHQTADRA